MSRFWSCIKWIACGLLSAGIVLAQATSCNQSYVVGTYALAFEGAVVVAPPGAQQTVLSRVGVYLVSINDQGAISSTGIDNIGGQFSQGPMPGWIKVNPDCSGAIDWGQGATATVAVLQNGAEIHSMMLTAAKPGRYPVIHGTWKRISRMPGELMSCSTASVVGTYTFRASGIVMVSPPGVSQPVSTPATLLGMASIGYDGTVVGRGTGVAGTEIISFGLGGTFASAADCTFTFAGKPTVGDVATGEGVIWGVVVDGGNELWGIQTKDPMGTPIYWGTWTRISPMP